MHNGQNPVGLFLSEFHFVIIRRLRFFFFFFGTRLAFRGLQSIGRDSLNAMLGTHPPPPHLKALLQLVSSGVSVMMGEDVLRGSLTTSGLSQQMSSKGEIGGIFRDYVHLKKPP